MIPARQIPLLLAFAAAGAAAPGHAADQPAADPDTGLAIAPGWELVKAHCGACHSYRLVTAQRGDESFWIDTIRWMQRTQNLWPIPEEQEQAIVAYLAEAYNETDWGRRPGLSPQLMPPQP